MSKESELTTGQNEVLFHSIKEIILHHRQHVFRAINSALLESYWSIGKLIVEDEQAGMFRAEYGTGTLPEAGSATLVGIRERI